MNAISVELGPKTTARGAVGSDETEARLLERLRAGEAAAFDSWVRAESPRALATARRIVGNASDAEDVVQDAFLRAYRALPGFAGNARLSTWLHRIVVNSALMQLRSRRRDPVDWLGELDAGETHECRVADAETHGPSAWGDREELRRVLAGCFARLPERSQDVLILRDFEGLDTEATAQALRIGKDAVKMRLHRARQTLRSLLEPYVRDGRLDAAYTLHCGLRAVTDA